LSLKQDKTDNTLGTTSKEIVGAINENKCNIDLKADKPIVIGGSGNIRLIGEIVNYTTFNGFNLEAMLHNAHQTNFSQTNNAFIAIGKYDNNTAIEGKLQTLYDTVYNNLSGYYKSTIQVTDTGKIYAINETYMTASSWNIIKKTDNVVIYNNPTIVSYIDGNVIWDSELNKTNIATSQQMEQKADEQWMYDDWKIESDLPTVYPDKSITYFLTSVTWNNGKIATSSVIKTIKHNGFITKQESFRSDGYPLYYRMVNTGTGQWGTWQITATTDKIDILCTANSGFTIAWQNNYQINNVVYYNLSVAKTNNTDFTLGENIVGTVPTGKIVNVTSVNSIGSDGLTYNKKVSALISSTRNIVASVHDASTKNIQISGVVVL